jgi:ribosomal protein S18 acetylase RimI-like enzyme
MPAGVELRPATAEDEAFLLAVYASTREQELAVVPWDAATKDAFVRMQFAAQHSHYRQQFPGASFDVVTVNGVPAGRLYVDRRPTEIVIVDVALLPAHRGRGIGTALLTPILDEAERTGRAVSIHVARENPARRLYERLGFVQVADQGVHLLLTRQVKIAS